MIRRGQISLEYLIVVGFVVFIVISLLGVAFYYASGVQDQIRSNQLTNFANKIITSAENVYFAGEPSKVTITAYLPAGVKNVSVVNDNGERVILVNIETTGGLSTLAFSSDVPIEVGDNIISENEGLKRLEIRAKTDINEVSITEN